MFYVVTGGSGSGKSAYAESVATGLHDNKKYGGLYYVATMYPYDDAETKNRIERHRTLRAGKGFLTVECYADIGSLSDMGSGNTILIECMSNLLANEMFLDEGHRVHDGEAVDRYIIEPLKKLIKNDNDVVVVTNEIFSDGRDNDYDSYTTTYIRLLGYINCCMAGFADKVTEVVCGIPVDC